MNDNLKGKTILIGKNPTQGNLLISIMGLNKNIVMGAAQSVPNSVSRCIPAQGIAHCKIDIDHSGKMRITNMKVLNTTRVDNQEVESRKITENSSVTLGLDRYPLNIPVILKAVESVFPKEAVPPKEYSITHLEKVWYEYKYELEKIQRAQQDRARKRMLPMMIGTASSVISPIFAIIISTSSLFITIPIAAFSFIIYFINYNTKDTSIEDRQEADDRFIEKYVCPNPECHHFIGYKAYKILEQDKGCPYCHCGYKSDK
ncbi:MAG: hypothetical protein LUC91_07655 [Prevotella sp.]|nr:hypothetical protein [Prevotella sp.]